MPASRPGDVVDKPAASRADGHRPPACQWHSGWRCRPRSAARPARCPRGLPTEKVSRATRSPGRAAKGRTRTGRFLAAVVRIPVAAAVSWARAATRWARRPSRWRPRICGPRRRQTPPLVGQVADQLAGAQGRPGDRLSEHPLDLVGWGRGRHSRRPAILGQQRGQPVALGATGPAVGGRAGDPEGAAGLGRAGRPGPVQDLDTPVVDDLNP
jgi:hypothetical protein